MSDNQPQPLIRIPGSITDSEFSEIYGKTVHSAIYHHTSMGMGIECRSWKGETENEIFILTLFSGLLSLCIAERPYQLQYNLNGIKYIGCFEDSLDLAQKTLSSSSTTQVMIKREVFIRNQTITFDEILQFLGWKYSPSFKLEEWLY